MALAIIKNHYFPVNIKIITQIFVHSLQLIVIIAAQCFWTIDYY